MKVKLPIPSMSDMKVSQYMKFLRTSEGKEDEGYINRLIVGTFCDIPDSVVNAMTKKSFDEVLGMIVSNLSQKENLPLQRIIKHNDIEYGFIPNLDEITVGEQADLSMYLTDWQKFDLALGVLYRPIKLKKGGKYLIEDYSGKPTKLDLPLDVAFGAYFFFVNLVKDCLSFMPSYIADQVKRDKRLQTLVQNGGGIKTFTHSLEETFSNLSRLVS